MVRGPGLIRLWSLDQVSGERQVHHIGEAGSILQVQGPYRMMPNGPLPVRPMAGFLLRHVTAGTSAKGVAHAQRPANVTAADIMAAVRRSDDDQDRGA